MELPRKHKVKRISEGAVGLTTGGNLGSGVTQGGGGDGRATTNSVRSLVRDAEGISSGGNPKTR